MRLSFNDLVSNIARRNGIDRNCDIGLELFGWKRLGYNC